MLSTTYVRIVCTNENNRIRKWLDRLVDESDKTGVMDESGISLPELVERIEFERNTRRFEKYVLPFIETDASRAGDVKNMNEIRKNISLCVAALLPILNEVTENGTIDRLIFVPEIRRYCDLIRKLLDYEEWELMMSTHESVAEDGWFGLAERFIKEDKVFFDGKYQNEKEEFDMMPDSSVWRTADVKCEYRI